MLVNSFDLGVNRAFWIRSLISNPDMAIIDSISSVIRVQGGQGKKSLAYPLMFMTLRYNV